MNKRLQITIPEDVVEEMDSIVKPRSRSRFIADALREHIDHIKFKKAISESLKYPGWKDEDHPELNEGTAEYISRLRSADQERI